MDKIPFRTCRLCHRSMEPGEPYWAHHAGAFIGTLTYCEQCMRATADNMRAGVKAALAELLDRAQQINGGPDKPQPVQGDSRAKRGHP